MYNIWHNIGWHKYTSWKVTKCEPHVPSVGGPSHYELRRRVSILTEVERHCGVHHRQSTRVLKVLWPVPASLPFLCRAPGRQRYSSKANPKIGDSSLARSELAKGTVAKVRSCLRVEPVAVPVVSAAPRADGKANGRARTRASRAEPTVPCAAE